MPFATPPALRIARSESTHSTLVLERTEAVSRAAKPIAIRPLPISRTAWAVCCQVQMRQMPSSFWRIHTLSLRALAAFQKMAGMVSPGVTIRVSGCGREVSHQLLIARSSPGFLLLPTAVGAHTFFLHAQVELLDVLLFAQAGAGVFHHDAAVLQHVAIVRRVERHVGVL